MIEDSISEEARVYGRLATASDLSIRLPHEYMHFLGLHVNRREFIKLGLDYEKDITNDTHRRYRVTQFIDRPSVFEVREKIRNTYNTREELIGLYNTFDPASIFVPQSLTDESVFMNRGSWFFSNKIPTSAIDKRDLEFELKWQELWNKIDYRSPITPQVAEYIQHKVAKTLRLLQKERDSQTVNAITANVASMRTDDFKVENGESVNIAILESPQMPKSEYVAAHKGLIIPCHDVMIEYNGGLLLVQRDNFPAKDILWPIGGRMLRGIPAIESLKRKVKDECGLLLEDKIVDLGWDRTFFETDPFGHGKGTDTVNQRFYAKGIGNLKLNDLHSKPTIVRPAEYTSSFRQNLHPYVQEFMDIAMKFVGRDLVVR